MPRREMTLPLTVPVMDEELLERYSPLTLVFYYKNTRYAAMRRLHRFIRENQGARMRVMFRMPGRARLPSLSLGVPDMEEDLLEKYSPLTLLLYYRDNNITGAVNKLDSRIKDNQGAGLKVTFRITRKEHECVQGHQRSAERGQE